MKLVLICLVFLLVTGCSGDSEDSSGVQTPGNSVNNTPDDGGGNGSSDDGIVSATIGSAGGVIEVLENSVSFQIPAGALDTDEQISLRALSDIEVAELLGSSEDSLAFEFSPTGTSFALPAKLSEKGTFPEPVDSMIASGSCSVLLVVFAGFCCSVSSL